MPIKEALPSRRGFLFGAAAAVVAITLGNALATPAEALILRGAPVPGGGSYINVPNAAALMVILNAGPAASGGKMYRLAAGDYGSLGIFNYDFRSNPILITGQSDPSLVTCSYFETNASGFTWENFTVNGSGAPSILIDDNGGIPPILTFSSVITDSGDAMGTQTGSGWVVNCPSLVGGSVTIRGRGDASLPDIWGRINGVQVVGSAVGGGTVTVTQMTAANVQVNGFISAGSQNTTFDGCYVRDLFYGAGDHPNGFHAFSNPPMTGTPTTNLTIRNCGVEKGSFGMGMQPYFFEDDVNTLVQNSWGYEDVFLNAFSNARGSGHANDNCFCQTFTSTGNGGLMIARGGAVNTTNTNNSVGTLTNYPADGVNPGYVPASPPGSNTLIPAATAYGDRTQLNIWLAAHPSARRSAA